jgi:predicted Rossmann fold nucleotide-binding protein DprA/Smf involved in DNA uptake
MKFAFFRRNEVLMALSHATVLGECPLHSGAKNAMLHARKLGRRRFSLPFRFGDARALGVWAEIMEQGAELIAEETPLVRFLEEYGEFEDSPFNERLGSPPGKLDLGPGLEQGAVDLAISSGSNSKGAKPGLGRPRGSRISTQHVGVVEVNRSESETLVLRAVLRGKLTVDAVCAATALPVEEVQHAVLVLTLTGELVEDDRGLLRFHGLARSVVTSQPPRPGT